VLAVATGGRSYGLPHKLKRTPAGRLRARRVARQSAARVERPGALLSGVASAAGLYPGNADGSRYQWAGRTVHEYTDL